MGVVVQKFGGTSVATGEEREFAIKKVIEAYKNGDIPVVVVSAMGQQGEPYATDTLLSLTDYDIDSSRDKDLLVSCGEVISSVVFSHELRNHGYIGQAFTGPQAGIKTDESFGNAKIEAVESSMLNNAINKGIIPVVAGFQGQTSNGDITTLGRGGSDTTAVALGVFLEADRVEIYTDVDCLMTADPRLVTDAKPIHEITFAELLNLAQEGAKVVHPRAAQMAMENHEPLYISCARGTSRGTRVSWKSDFETYKYDDNRIMSGIAHMDNISQIVISPEQGNFDLGFQYEIFDALAAQNVSVDFINVLTTGIYLTVDNDKVIDAKTALEKLPVKIEINDNCTKISLVGLGMKGVSGIMKQIFATLNSKQVPVLQIADSNTTVSCLIPSELKKTALTGLHKTFSL